jgi:hypothetical protein
MIHSFVERAGRATHRPTHRQDGPPSSAPWLSVIAATKIAFVDAIRCIHPHSRKRAMGDMSVGGSLLQLFSSLAWPM